MAILVTGGAGYIGSHMVLALKDAGREVVVLDDLSTGFAAALPSAVTLVRGDVGDMALAARIIAEHEVDAVVHFAGSIVVPESVANPLYYYLNNTSRTRSLIEAAVAGGVKRFIFSSTAAVYGIPEVNPVAEDAPLRPISPYGASKMMSEIMLADAARAHDLAFVALRYFNVAGADPAGRCGQSTPRATHLIKVAAQAALGQRDGLDVYGTDYATADGTCERDYIHVSDLADAHMRALAYLESGGDSLIANCGYGRGYSVRAVVDAVKRASGVDFPVRFVDRRPGDPAALVARADQARERLGWTPTLADLDTIVGHALRWERRLADEIAAAE